MCSQNKDFGFHNFLCESEKLRNNQTIRTLQSSTQYNIHTVIQSCLKPIRATKKLFNKAN